MPKNIWIYGELLLGDYLMQTPAIRGLQKKYPDSFIYYVTPEEAVSRPLVMSTPGIKKVFKETHANALLCKGDLQLKHAAPDAFVWGARNGVTMAQAYCELWKVPFDGGWYKINVLPTELDIPNINKCVVLARHSRSCTSNDPKIGTPNKCLSNDFWLQVMDYLEGKGLTPIVVGASEDEIDPKYNAVSTECKSLYGKPILNIASLLSQVKFTIAVDTGIRHLAAAVGGNLLTLNSAIPFSLIRCEPQSESQKIIEVNVNINDPEGAFHQIKKDIDILCSI